MLYTPEYPAAWLNLHGLIRYSEEEKIPLAATVGLPRPSGLDHSTTMGQPELPLALSSPSGTPSSSPPPRTPTRRQLALLLLLLPCAFYLSFTRSTPLDLLSRVPVPCSLRADPAPLPNVKAASCPAQVEPRRIGADWHPEVDAEYVNKAVERLQGAIRIRTESFDDMNLDPSKEPRFEIMGQLHEYLERTFPRVFKELEVEKVQKYGLLLTWKGKDEGLKPVVLMAHQDVVPVNKATESQWTYPPFEAHQDENGWIWGRGSADCKNTLIGIFAALDRLVLENFVPPRTIILSSGFDEEIGGSRSAAHLASTLQSRYGENGIALVLDEGFTGVDTAFGGTTFARFGVAEKGAVNVKLDVLTPGGHSSVPRGAHTGIGLLARLLVALEDHPSSPELRAGNPVLSYLNCAADYGKMDKGLKRRLRRESEWKKLGEEMAREDDVVRAFLGTTQAVDLVQGGVKINALPEYTTASINYRIDFLSSVNATLSRIASVLSPVISSLNLTFDAYGTHPDIENNVVRLSVVEGSEIEPAPLTPTEGEAWDLMAGTTRGIWEGAVVAPSGMGRTKDAERQTLNDHRTNTANTDTKYSWPLTRNIYRFVPGSLDLIKNFHTVDERQLLRNLEGWEAE
ncbi:SPOSA6832_04155 [Sporobolomyces salmonicolor]|uniref:SPOSA6832_04155-mRNA-1:cds n=1 Tax=Sporidiobolus salmonicolor TaxID=5005 RepID=A0A0D6ERC7_SPOSA|nr:SPOSA6832_04155 [Sporobolomyces salmonicolor]